MDIDKLKAILEETQRNFPPHYPTKTHDIAYEVYNTIERLKIIVDYIGFSDANIAIKNIVGKMINQFLITTKHDNKGQDVNCDFNITNQEIDNGIKTIISSNEKSLELKYLNDGSITITNDHYCFSTTGGDYSDSVINYNNSTPNQMFLEQSYINQPICKAMLSFNDDGIEVSKEFKITPRKRRLWQPTNQYISGSIVRGEDFYTASIKLNAVGDPLDRLLSKEDIEKINSIPEIKVPIMCIGALDTDLNLLFDVIKCEKVDGLKGGSFKYLIDSYLYNSSSEAKEDFEGMYNDSQKIVESSLCLEHSFYYMGQPIIHGPYSNEILHNIKRTVSLEKSDHGK